MQITGAGPADLVSLEWKSREVGTLGNSSSALLFDPPERVNLYLIVKLQGIGKESFEESHRIEGNQQSDLLLISADNQL